MYTNLYEYLKGVERHLHPLSKMDRLDIIREIDSNIQELQQDKGISLEEALERLGSPRELAKSYLGNSIATSSKGAFRKICEFMAFYSLVGLTGMIVLPVTGITAATFLLCAVLVPVAGAIKWIISLFGVDIPFVMVQIGSFAANPFQAFVISLLLAVLFWLLGKWLWKITIAYIKAVGNQKEKRFGSMEE